VKTHEKVVEKRIAVRLPGVLAAALEKERQRISKKGGAEVKMSAVIRAILEQRLLA
jgi:hypothetical protein